MKKVSIMLLVVFLLSSLLITPIVGAQNGNGKVAENQITDELIQVVDQHIEIRGKAFVLVNVNELKSKISQEDYILVRKHIVETNEMLRNTKDVKKFDNLTFVYEISDEEVKNLLEEAGYEYSLESTPSNEENVFSILRYEFNGENKFLISWWGVEVWLSKNTVATLSGLSVGAVSTAIAIMFPPVSPWAYWIASSFVGLYASSIAKPIIIGYNFSTLDGYVIEQRP